MQRFLAHHRRPRGHAVTAREVASGALRRRVLDGVRREDRPRRSTAFKSAIAVGLLVGATGAVLTLDPFAAQRPTILSVSAHLHRSGDHGELQLSGLPEPPPGEVYEVWLERGGGRPQPTDVLFTVTSTGQAAVEVPGSLRGLHHVSVTPEPLGGSSTPTGPIVLSIAVMPNG